MILNILGYNVCSRSYELSLSDLVRSREMILEA